MGIRMFMVFYEVLVVKVVIVVRKKMVSGS